MKFIQFSGSKGITSKTSNKTTYCQHGIFECPICKAHVERTLSIGKRNKSCGNKECRKAAGNFRGTLHPSSKELISTNPYYTNIASIHATLRNDTSISLDDSWKKLSLFFKDVIEDYTKFRNEHKSSRMSFKIPDKSLDVSRDNFEFTVYTRNHTKIKKYIPTGTAVSYLYILECKEMYKIGIATDVARRVQHLKTGNPFDINVLLSIKVKSATTLEAFLHALYSDKRVSGEWFDLTVDDIQEITEYIHTTVNDGLWNGDELIKHQTISSSSHRFLDATERAKTIEDAYVSALSGPTASTIREDVTAIPTVPKKLYKRKKKDSPLYHSWNTMKNKCKRGFTYDEDWDDFFKFEEDLINSYKTIANPVMTVEGNHYNITTVAFIDRGDFNSKTAAVAAMKDDKVVATYQSIKEAAKAVNGTPAHITACCKGNRKKHAGYSWSYLDNQ